jgi:hypothetical protein
MESPHSIEKEHLEKVMSYVELAASEGGKIVFGGTYLVPKVYNSKSAVR